AAARDAATPPVGDIHEVDQYEERLEPYREEPMERVARPPAGAPVMADASRAEGVTARMSPGALPVDSSPPPHPARPPPTSDEAWDNMVHDGIGGVNVRGQRKYVATPAVT
ncbi:unnamed protein product, partial [Pylaiella littoralis]